MSRTPRNRRCIVKGTPDRTLALLAVLATCALVLVTLVALGTDPTALPGAAAVVAAMGLAVKRMNEP